MRSSLVRKIKDLYKLTTRIGVELRIYNAKFHFQKSPNTKLFCETSFQSDWILNNSNSTTNKCSDFGFKISACDGEEINRSLKLEYNVQLLMNGTCIFFVHPRFPLKIKSHRYAVVLCLCELCISAEAHGSRCANIDCKRIRNREQLLNAVHWAVIDVAELFHLCISHSHKQIIYKHLFQSLPDSCYQISCSKAIYSFNLRLENELACIHLLIILNRVTSLAIKPGTYSINTLSTRASHTSREEFEFDAFQYMDFESKQKTIEPFCFLTDREIWK